MGRRHSGEGARTEARAELCREPVDTRPGSHVPHMLGWALLRSPGVQTKEAVGFAHPCYRLSGRGMVALQLGVSPCPVRFWSTVEAGVLALAVLPARTQTGCLPVITVRHCVSVPTLGFPCC
uniref:Uncharacterized protein n=1 Tax=Molossus molossus TaxID=27622 RepID=A0A7J8I109_MOLMO|nr:hypothetical protein HJG59_010761 [Molossus molossus]